MAIYSTLIPSPLGDLLAIASDDHLLMLEFADSRELAEKLARTSLRKEVSWAKRKTEDWWLEDLNPQSSVRHETGGQLLSQGASKILSLATTQLWEYFEWTRKQFDIPLRVDGTDFQKDAWKWLQAIPYGETRSYGEQARMISRDRAVRAIGGANHNNRIVIIIPCHRVIGASGKLVGYGGGLPRKVWLLEHEKKYK